MCNPDDQPPGFQEFRNHTDPPGAQVNFYFHIPSRHLPRKIRSSNWKSLESIVAPMTFCPNYFAKFRNVLNPGARLKVLRNPRTRDPAGHWYGLPRTGSAYRPRVPSNGVRLIRCRLTIARRCRARLPCGASRLRRPRAAMLVHPAIARAPRAGNRLRRAPNWTGYATILEDAEREA